MRLSLVQAMSSAAVEQIVKGGLRDRVDEDCFKVVTEV